MLMTKSEGGRTRTGMDESGQGTFKFSVARTRTGQNGRWKIALDINTILCIIVLQK